MPFVFFVVVRPDLFAAELAQNGLRPTPAGYAYCRRHTGRGVVAVGLAYWHGAGLANGALAGPGNSLMRAMAVGGAGISSLYSSRILPRQPLGWGNVQPPGGPTRFLPFCNPRTICRDSTSPSCAPFFLSLFAAGAILHRRKTAYELGHAEDRFLTKIAT